MFDYNLMRLIVQNYQIEIIFLISEKKFSHAYQKINVSIVQSLPPKRHRYINLLTILNCDSKICYD